LHGATTCEHGANIEPLFAKSMQERKAAN